MRRTSVRVMAVNSWPSKCTDPLLAADDNRGFAAAVGEEGGDEVAFVRRITAYFIHRLRERAELPAFAEAQAVGGVDIGAVLGAGVRVDADADVVLGVGEIGVVEKMGLGLQRSYCLAADQVFLPRGGAPPPFRFVLGGRLGVADRIPQGLRQAAGS